MPRRQACAVYTGGRVALKHRRGRGPFARLPLIWLMHERKGDRLQTSHSELPGTRRSAVTATRTLGKRCVLSEAEMCARG